VDSLFDIMAAFFESPSYGTNLATNFTSYNDPNASAFWMVFNITTSYYTSSTSSGIST
jgi:hypothetical protein